MILPVSVLATLAILLPLFVNGQNVAPVGSIFLSPRSDNLVGRAPSPRVSPKYNHDFEFPLPIMPVKESLASVLLFLVRS